MQKISCVSIVFCGTWANSGVAMLGCYTNPINLLVSLHSLILCDQRAKEAMKIQRNWPDKTDT
jgi:hypothetical protein